MSVNGTLVEDKICRFKGECAHLASTSVPFTLTKAQVPNLALIHTKRITVYSVGHFFNGLTYRDHANRMPESYIIMSLS